MWKQRFTGRVAGIPHVLFFHFCDFSGGVLRVSAAFSGPCRFAFPVAMSSFWFSILRLVEIVRFLYLECFLLNAAFLRLGGYLVIFLVSVRRGIPAAINNHALRNGLFLSPCDVYSTASHGVSHVRLSFL